MIVECFLCICQELLHVIIIMNYPHAYFTIIIMLFGCTNGCSLVPRPICGRRKNGRVSIVCACAEYPTIRGVSDLYVNSPCNFPLYFTYTLVYCWLADVSSLANCMSCACCVEQRLAFALQKVGKGRLTLKKEQLSAIRSAYD